MAPPCCSSRIFERDVGRVIIRFDDGARSGSRIIQISWLRVSGRLETGKRLKPAAPQKCLRLINVYAINFIP
jgi:hypothetical protein